MSFFFQKSCREKKKSHHVPRGFWSHGVWRKKMTDCDGQTPIHHFSPWWEQFSLGFIFYCLCSVELAEDTFTQTKPEREFYLGVKLMVLQRFDVISSFFLFLLCVKFNLTIHLHLILAKTQWNCPATSCCSPSSSDEHYYYFVCVFAPKLPSPPSPIVFFFTLFVHFFADCVICVGSVADCTVSVYSFALGCVLDCFLTQTPPFL